jgi:hypothetical protein
MAEILEYDYYDATLTVTISTARPEAAPSTLFVAGSLHTEYVAKVRAVLREKRDALTPYLPVAGGYPIYGIRKIMPAGAMRTVESDYFMETTRQRFDLGVALLPSAWQAGELVALGVERNLEKAIKDLFAAEGIPFAVIPGDNDKLGDSYVDIMCELGPATNQGVINDVNG